MAYHAAVSQDPFSHTAELRLVYEGSNRRAAASLVDVDGSIVFVDSEEGEQVDPFLRIPLGALPALRDALNEHVPPTDDTDLREALSVERERVNRIIDNALRSTA